MGESLCISVEQLEQQEIWIERINLKDIKTFSIQELGQSYNNCLHDLTTKHDTPLRD